MTDEKKSPIYSSMKIIVDVKFPKETGTNNYFIDLHDNEKAVCFNFDKNEIDFYEKSIYEKGRHDRWVNHTMPFECVRFLEYTRADLGHNCVDFPINPDCVGDRSKVGQKQVFSPTVLNLIYGPDISGCTEECGSCSPVQLLYGPHNLGTTATPLLVPTVKGTYLEEKIGSADKCVELIIKTLKWTKEVENKIREYQSNKYFNGDLIKRYPTDDEIVNLVMDGLKGIRKDVQDGKLKLNEKGEALYKEGLKDFKEWKQKQENSSAENDESGENENN
ncbi:hypothetical protein ACFL1H_03050 [Nanoarchaeota archaeon]